MLKKALVTGSGVGIGRAIALDLAEKGFDVAFHYNRNAEAANQASQEAAKNIDHLGIVAGLIDEIRIVEVINQKLGVDN